MDLDWKSDPIDSQYGAGVRWPRFLPAALGTLVAAAILAGALHVLFILGWYIVMLAASMAALVLASAVYLAVRLGHCRNRLIAAGLGTVAGLVMYLGQYHIDMIHKAGPAAALRIDALPRYIALRKSLEIQQKLGPRAGAKLAAGNQPQNANPPGKVDAFGNWLFFGLELTFVLCCAVAVGVFAAGHPYCERCQKWMRRAVSFLPPGTGPAVVAAAEANRLADLMTLPSLPPPQKGSYTALIASWCEPPSGYAAHGPVFLSVKAVRRGGGPTQFSQVDAVLGRRLLWMRPLPPAQVKELSRRLPALAPIVRRWEQVNQQQEREQDKDTPVAGALASVQQVPAIASGSILSTRAKLVGNLLSLIPLLMLAAAIPLGAVGYFVFGAQVATGLTLIMLAALLATSGIGIIAADIGWLSRRYLLRRARAAIELRGDAVVRPDDPDALFMQVVPRERWGKLGLDTASDVGFLKIDAARRELLFEGDRERYRIPAESIVSCDVEKIVYGPSTERETCIFVSVLRARAVQGIFEVPLGQRGDLKQSTVAKRHKWAEDFTGRVRRLTNISSRP